MPASEPSKAGCNSPDLIARDATMYRRRVSKVKNFADIRYTASIFGSRASCPKEADMGQVQESKTVLGSGDRPDGHTTCGGKQGTIRPHHWVHRQRRGGRLGGMLVHSRELVKFWSGRQKGYFTIVVGLRILRCGDNWSGVEHTDRQGEDRRRRLVP